MGEHEFRALHEVLKVAGERHRLRGAFQACEMSSSGTPKGCQLSKHSEFVSIAKVGKYFPAVLKYVQVCE